MHVSPELGSFFGKEMVAHGRHWLDRAVFCCHASIMWDMDYVLPKAKLVRLEGKPWR